MSERIWLTWEHQTRNASMARLLDCRYIELFSGKSRTLRYFILASKTLFILCKLRPKELFFQNPSIVLSVICALYKIMNRHAKVIGDFHNAALNPSKLSALNSFVAKRIDITLVSNENLCERVKEMDGMPFVMPDPIPEKHSASNEEKSLLMAGALHDKFIVFICSWASDEPIVNVLSAYIKSSVNEQGVLLYVTGRVRLERLNLSVDQYYQLGIRFLGFVNESQYWQLIETSVCNIDLTTREDCLVCGAYESIAVGNSVILSGNAASKSYFQDYCVYTDNSESDLSHKIIEMVRSEVTSREKAEKARLYFKDLDQERKASLVNLLSV